MKYLIWLTTVFTILCSCTSNNYMKDNYPRLKMQGENATVEVYKQKPVTAEMLYIQQDSIYLQIEGSKNTFYKVALADVNKLTVDLYVNKDWIAPVILLQFLPATVFTLVGATVSGGGGVVLLVSFLPGISTSALFISGTPEKPVYNLNSIANSRQDIAKYCRYPMELTPENFEKSFKHKLSEFKSLSEL